jgi:ATP-dependent DNA helicase RecG
LDLISLLRKPLEFASGLDPERLRRMPDLEKSLHKILESHPRQEEEFQRFKASLKGLDELSGEARMERVIALIRILDRMERKAEVDRLGRNGSAARGRSPDEKHTLGLLKDLETDAQYVKGVGPKMADKLLRLGIATAGDILYHLPSRYEDRRNLIKIRDVEPDQHAMVQGEVMVCGVAVRRGRRRMFNMMISDGTGVITAKWFNYKGDWLEKKFGKGQWVTAGGVARVYNNNLEMHHPDVEVLEGEDGGESGSLTGIVPVYPLTEGVFQKSMRRIVNNACDAFLDKIPEALPPRILEKRSLIPLSESLAMVHRPPEDSDINEYNTLRSPGRRRLVYEEFFLLQLGLALRRQGMVEEPAVPIKPAGALAKRFRESLPFVFTGSQEKVTAEILADMERPHPMLRLLQGDVGSGKTVVAVAAALSCIEAGRQVAIMAPTEILAEQHQRTLEKMLEGLSVKPELLTGAVRGSERERILAGVADGSAPLVVGTHALIQEAVKFKGLALGIIDEQHRFGVLQRAELKAKGPDGTSPHLLVMTATPIPRTLAMTVYGDLAVSVIREMPPGRKPIKTEMFRENDRAEAYRQVRQEVGRGRQVYVVYPLVEESENLELRDATSMADDFKDVVFPDLRVGLLHGRLSSDEKDAVMRDFLKGDIDVLAATTVIEVGIDVPNASMIVIEHAERFGLSQLHQLRGRVGRGEHPSRCLLVAGFTRSEDAWKRLMVMKGTSDGFEIAEEDLAIRGPGEFFGTRQSGLPDLLVANIIRDADILSEAREDAFETARIDPRLEKPGHFLLRTLLKLRWGGRFNLGAVA